ncbi:Uncharacterized beta-barrel protein ywiB [Staphylococcus delphini]|nr:Uncharacterized beta-barrel protein ywiB [Staphylococcus delphini]
MTMEHNIKIDVHQIVKRDAEKEHFSHQTTGQWLKKGEDWIRYQEQIEDATVNVTIKLTDESVKLMRKGDINMNMHFIEGQDTTTFYELPHGKMVLTVHTMSILHFVTPDGGKLKVHYALFQGDEKMGTYQYEMKYKEI